MVQLITVRLRSKSCLQSVVRYGAPGEKASSGKKLRPSQQAGVGSKTRSAGRTPLHRISIGSCGIEQEV